MRAPRSLSFPTLALCLTLAFLIAVVGLGCTRERTHTVLTFLFDGVPPLDALPARDVVVPGEVVPTAAPRIEFMRHKPLEDGKCDACHAKAQGLALAESFDRRGGCFRCHEHQAHKERFERHRFLHGPLAVSSCLVCHDAHESQYPPLLVRPDPDLCYGCHDRTTVSASRGHQDLQEDTCLGCHDPHGGDDPFFLRSEGAEGDTSPGEDSDSLPPGEPQGGA